MKKISIVTILAVLFSFIQLTAQQSISDEYALGIRVDGLYDYVDAFTSPRLEGRRMGTRGGQLAAEYIEN